MNWHQELSDFGTDQNHPLDPNDPDSKLLSAIVHKTCIPKLEALFLNCYDLYSRSSTENAIKSVDGILDYLSSKSDGYQVI